MLRNSDTKNLKPGNSSIPDSETKKEDSNPQNNLEEFIQEFYCDFCNSELLELHACQCKKVKYCSLACLNQNLPSHKTICQALLNDNRIVEISGVNLPIGFKSNFDKFSFLSVVNNEMVTYINILTKTGILKKIFEPFETLSVSLHA